MRLPWLPFLLLLLSSGLAAQERPTAIYLGGGASFPGDRHFDRWKTGFNIGGGVDLPLSRTLRLHADVDHTRLEPDFVAYFGPPAGNANLDGFERSLTSVMAMLRLLPFPSARTVQPYLLAGGGYWRDALEPIRGIGGGGTDHDIATAVGGGVSVLWGESGRIASFLEGRYVIGEMNLEYVYTPVKIGISIVP